MPVGNVLLLADRSSLWTGRILIAANIERSIEVIFLLRISATEARRSLFISKSPVGRSNGRYREAFRNEAMHSFAAHLIDDIDE